MADRIVAIVFILHLFAFASSSEAMKISRRTFIKGVAATAATKGAGVISPAAAPVAAVAKIAAAPAFDAALIAGRASLFRDGMVLFDSLIHMSEVGPAPGTLGPPVPGEDEAWTLRRHAFLKLTENSVEYDRISQNFGAKMAQAALRAAERIGMPLTQLDEEIVDAVARFNRETMGYHIGHVDRHFASIGEKFRKAFVEELSKEIPPFISKYVENMTGPTLDDLPDDWQEETEEESQVDQTNRPSLASPANQNPSLAIARKNLLSLIKSRCERALSDPSVAITNDRRAQATSSLPAQGQRAGQSPDHGVPLLPSPPK